MRTTERRESRHCRALALAVLGYLAHAEVSGIRRNGKGFEKAGKHQSREEVRCALTIGTVFSRLRRGSLSPDQAGLFQGLFKCSFGGFPPSFITVYESPVLVSPLMLFAVVEVQAPSGRVGGVALILLGVRDERPGAGRWAVCCRLDGPIVEITGDNSESCRDRDDAAWASAMAALASLNSS